ncbi:MAG: hypothetical protein IK078_01285 [Lachnospiraceae bacterium]|nr:hypothetical protein [Lachnospiraceae bacterium]
MKKIKAYWSSLDEDTVINRKLLFFEFVTAVLAGVLLGILITPFRSITIASNNEGCANGNSADGNDVGTPDEDEDE